MRAMDPAWLARWGLTLSSDLTDRAIIESHIELAAQAEWIAYVAGTGLDPRKLPCDAGSGRPASP